MTQTETHSNSNSQFFGRTLMAVFFVATVLGLAIPNSHSQLNQDQAIIYRDFTYVMRDNNRDWRVTDPKTGFQKAKRFLPNPMMYIQIGDLEGATRAEAIIDLWGGHPGTSKKQLRFNGNAWIDIPELSTTPAGIEPECFIHQWNPVVDIPLEYLHEGTNILEGLSGPQVCKASNFGWGQWGWYGITVRVYYDPAVRAHPVGEVVSPVPNAFIGEDPLIEVSASGDIPIARVDVMAFYDGADENGDGVHADWHAAYVSPLSQNSMPLSEHVGTATTAPYAVTWDTHWIPDQPAQGIQFKALITDTSGMVFETPPVSGVSLQRDDVTVKHYSAEDVPEAFWVRANRTKVSKFTIPKSDDLLNATEARVHFRTWNGINQDALINGVAVPVGGANHEFKYTKPTVPVSILNTGLNVVSFHAPTEHHGIEVAWPGPGVTVRYTIDR
jgi:hypothetical protein